MSVVKPNLSRIVFLDALRGMAAFSVLIYHLQNYFINSSHKADYETSVVSFSKLLLDNINLGLFGVVLFFLISGFIIPQTLNSRTTVLKFSINRFFRLYPAFWASILITIIVGPMVGAGEFSGIQILANATMVPKIFGQDLINGIYWTLFVELIFYVICAAMFVVKLLDNVKAVGVIALALALVSPMSILLNLNGLHVPIQFLTLHVSFLFLGNLIRIGFKDKQVLAQYFVYIFIALNVFVLPLCLGVLSGFEHQYAGALLDYGARATLVAFFGAICIFLLAIYFSKPNSSVLLFLGKISYSLYLTHWICCLVVLHFISINNSNNQLIVAALSILLSVLVAYILYLKIEKPFVELGVYLRERVAPNVSKFL